MGVFDPPKKPVNKIAARRFTIDVNESPRTKAEAVRKSSGSYAGAAPRVGSDKKKTVKVSKPSSVESGWRSPSKKSKKKR